MTILDRLARAQGRNDERPNVELGEELAASGNESAIAELVAALAAEPVAAANDALKVLCEVGARKPELIAGHAGAFLTLLESRNNRSVWGALEALNMIAELRHAELAENLDRIIDAADRSSVIAKDQTMAILAKLARVGHAKALPVLLARLRDAAPNQFPMYAEFALAAVDPARAPELRQILETRLPNIPQPAKRARVHKVLRKLPA